MSFLFNAGWYFWTFPSIVSSVPYQICLHRPDKVYLKLNLNTPYLNPAFQASFTFKLSLMIHLSMRTSDKNVGRKFNIEKTSSLRQIALLMRNDYHRWAGAGVLIKKYSTCRRFSGWFYVPLLRLQGQSLSRGSGNSGWKRTTWDPSSVYNVVAQRRTSRSRRTFWKLDAQRHSTQR